MRGCDASRGFLTDRDGTVRPTFTPPARLLTQQRSLRAAETLAPCIFLSGTRMDVRGYGTQLMRALSSHDTATVTSLLDFSGAASKSRGVALLQSVGVSVKVVGDAGVGSQALAEQFKRSGELKDGWEQVAACCVCAAAVRGLPGFGEGAAYAQSHAALQYLKECLDNVSGSWIVPSMLHITRECEALCRAVSWTKLERDKQMEVLVSTLRNLFGACIKDIPTERVTDCKRMGCLALANLCFKLYFKLNTPRQCQHIVTPILQKKVHEALQYFPLSVVVTYKYYMGRLAMFQDKYGEANDALTQAFEQCHRGGEYQGNRRRILELLIPVRLLLGFLPTPALLEEYGFTQQYGGIVRGVRLGDVQAYRNALEEHMHAFVRSGVYLTLDKLQLIVVRTLIKRLSRIYAKHQLPLPLFSLVFQSPAIAHPSMPLDEEELECILAVLIHRRFIKGYISHKPLVLVCAKEREKAFPFPWPRD